MSDSNNQPVIIIFGAGANIGSGVADAFSNKGYKVAIVSRGSPAPALEGRGYLHVKGDLADEASIEAAYNSVVDKLGIPSVVVHNAYSNAMAPSNDDPLQVPIAGLQKDLAVNTISVLKAAQLATSGFAKLPESASKTFIYTGNKSNIQAFPPFLNLGITKSASSHLIAFAAKAYGPKGWKFYYADERSPEGAPAFANIDGKAHGDFYAELSEKKTQGPWLATFVKGTGYVKFDE
ncbi:hypothetical protein NM208_g5216 [Fusarium decemcellulare]|uniref:Uncharacterized protein n=1 Tax=Fusarium decemcellulare TaxID=57161 RepID=A0ACC1SHT5_9HYPO|nr:hypothetical protein NM208_g5216 [Fusarium decemcellulare]